MAATELYYTTHMLRRKFCGEWGILWRSSKSAGDVCEPTGVTPHRPRYLDGCGSSPQECLCLLHAVDASTADEGHVYPFGHAAEYVQGQRQYEASIEPSGDKAAAGRVPHRSPWRSANCERVGAGLDRRLA